MARYYFITTKGPKENRKINQISVEDILLADNDTVFDFGEMKNDETSTRTYMRDIGTFQPEEWKTGKDAIRTLISDKGDVRFSYVRDINYHVSNYLMSVVEAFISYNNTHYEFTVNNNRKYYRSFCIPKRSGGMRPIDAPSDELKKAQTELKELIESFCVPYHNSAYAYIQKRSTKDSAIRHQKFGGDWYFKSDLTNFFGSTTRTFVYEQMRKIFPFSHLSEADFNSYVKPALNVAFLDGVLPQGSAISPMLTNLIMIPIDYEITRWCAEHRCVYTRYADDMEISSKERIGEKVLTDMINRILANYDAPYKINDDKTRYGSRAGHNYMLGLCINKDNHITVGHETKKVFKATLFNFMKDFQAGKVWDKHSVLTLQGNLNYYKMIEPGYIEHVICNYTKKFSMSPMSVIKFILRSK